MTVPPGSTIGIVGGGQLGRMLALAAAQLGYRCHVYAPDEAPPAAEVAAAFTRGAYDDEAALWRFGESVDVATFEFENIAAGPLGALASAAPLHPPQRALEVSQDRLAEKEFLVGLGGRPAPFARIDAASDLGPSLEAIGTPALLKTRRFGYDGKGQIRIDSPDDAMAAWDEVGGVPCIAEAFVAYDAEFSILLCRGQNGETRLWDAPRNVHRRGILDQSIVPADAELAPAIASGATLARAAAEELDHVGVMAIEFFAIGEQALFNEMAPRVHNSGHWTIEGALTSQFENHVRAICGLPLGDTARIAAKVEMQNLIGDDVEGWRDLLADPRAHVHLYGKDEARRGRKMGHVTRLLGIAGS